MEKLLVICGPTSTGKTSLALSLAKKFDGEIVSADSRQVYKDLNIGTGKDLPPGSRCQTPTKNLPCYYVIGKIKVWGYDLVEAKKDYSVGQYTRVARRVIKNIISRGKLPILVGGTGLYIKAAIDGIATADVPRNLDLRKTLVGKATKELYDILAQFDSVKAGSMNQSDRANPRRLVRAIEVASYKGQKKVNDSLGVDTLFVGLGGSKELVDRRIKLRVEKRVKDGLEKEIRSLLQRGIKWTDQSMSSLGYKQWKIYFEGKETKDKVVEKWCKEEEHYAKRQMTWFKKDKRIHWFAISDKNWQENVEDMVKKWYSTN